jgi:hypothetical protein
MTRALCSGNGIGWNTKSSLTPKRSPPPGGGFENGCAFGGPDDRAFQDRVQPLLRRQDETPPCLDVLCLGPSPSIGAGTACPREPKGSHLTYFRESHQAISSIAQSPPQEVGDETSPPLFIRSINGQCFPWRNRIWAPKSTCRRRTQIGACRQRESTNMIDPALD